MFKFGDYVRISKHENIFAKGYIRNLSEEAFVIKSLKTLFHGPMLFAMLTVKKLLEHFTKKNWKKKSARL